MEKSKKRKEIKKAFLQRVNRYDRFNELVNDLRKEYRYNFTLEELEDYKMTWNAFKRHQEHDKKIYEEVFKQLGYFLLAVTISIITLYLSTLV